MRATPTPWELYSHASKSWRNEDETDQRSSIYEVAEREVLSAPKKSHSTRATNWIQALHRYEQFWCAHGHAPRENTRNRENLPASERRLGEWARYQRRFQETLCRYQEIRLDVSPAFDWDPHEAAWERTLLACQDHLARTGNLPVLASGDPRQFALARWLNRQLRLRQEERLSALKWQQVADLLEQAKAANDRL